VPGGKNVLAAHMIGKTAHMEGHNKVIMGVLKLKEE
jgi:hypothetical protein